MEIKNKKISILGAVRSGISAAILAKKLGAIPFVSDVTSSNEIVKSCKRLDNLKINYELGNHSERVFDCDFIITSPGVPSNSSVLVKANNKGLKVISEIEFASWFCKGRIIAITGTNGKTTTTTLCAHVINGSNNKCYLAGNIGIPFSEIVLDIKEEEYVALEVSSFQLDYIENFNPDYAVVLNITPDHLDRYEDRFDLYIKSKMRITKNQNSDKFFIYNGDDTNIPMGYVDNTVMLFTFSLDKSLSNGSFVENGIIHYSKDGIINEICSVDNLALKGEHNLQNTLAIVNVTKNIGIETKTIKAALENFEGVEHRLEFVNELKGITVINDSKATNVDAVKYALRSFNEPIFLILGGKDKGNDYSKIKDEVRDNVRKIYAIGSSAEKIFNFFKNTTDIEIVDSLEETVSKAMQEAIDGSVLLLSPACASFDMFKSYEDRGNQFKQIVNNFI